MGMNLSAIRLKMIRWRIQRQRRRDSLERIRKEIVIVGRAGVIRCDSIGRPPQIDRSDEAK